MKAQSIIGLLVLGLVPAASFYACDASKVTCEDNRNCLVGGQTGSGGMPSGGAANAGTSPGGSPGTGGIPPCNGACTGPTPICEVSSNQCVACIQDSNCPADTVCDTEQHVCVGCMTDAHCPALSPACKVADNICVGCTSNSHCTAPKGVCDTDNTCVQCLASTDCVGVTGKSACDIETKTCVECVTNVLPSVFFDGHAIRFDDGGRPDEATSVVTWSGRLIGRWR